MQESGLHEGYALAEFVERIYTSNASSPRKL